MITLSLASFYCSIPTIDNNEDKEDNKNEVPTQSKPIKKRLRFTLQETRRKIENFHLSMQAGLRDINPDQKQLTTWQKELIRIQEARKKRYSDLHRTTIPQPIQDHLLHIIFYFKSREMGVMTTIFMLKAASLSGNCSTVLL